MPSIFDTCRPRPEVLAGTLPDSIFAADLWDVITRSAHDDYKDAQRFFRGTYATENIKVLVRDVAERLAGVEGGTPVYRLETGFGGGKTHSLIAAVHVAREGDRLAALLTDYRIAALPAPGATQIAAFVGEESDPLNGKEHIVDGQAIRTYTPWGQIALLSGGVAGYEIIKESDQQGVTPDRGDLERALGDKPVLILLDELVLYMARAFALRDDHPRSKVNSQWPTFLQTLFSIAARRPKTVAILTLPSEQDANRKLTGALKQHIPTVLETVDELEKTAARQARNLTPTQSTERAAVLGRRLFESVDATGATDVAHAYVEYYAAQSAAGVEIDSRAFEASYEEQIRAGYPFHPELIRLFAERLADIPEFQATRGALRLVARTIRATWERKNQLGSVPLLQPQHVDLARSDMRDEVLARLGRTAFERGLDADVVSAAGGAHAGHVDAGWPWPAAMQASSVAFLHSLPDGSRGVTAAEAALALGQPGRDLAYVAKGLEDTERRAWYMRRDADYFLFRTRASINKRFQERLAAVGAAEVTTVLDDWIKEVYSGFSSFQVIPFPDDHTALPDNPDRVRLVIVHYDKECGAVGGGDRLNITKDLFTRAGANASPRRYRNNIVFLLAESTRVPGIKDQVRSLVAWERVQRDLEAEQTALAQANGKELRTLKDAVRRGATGIPAEFMALESDLDEVRERLGTQSIGVRTRLLEAYRVLAFPQGSLGDQMDLFGAGAAGPLLECFRVDFGETPDPAGRTRSSARTTVAEAPILQSLRQNNKLVPEPSGGSPVVLAPSVVRRPPLWQQGERRLATEEVWDRLRREPELPIVLRQADLLPTFTAGLTANPDPLWVYYDQAEKRVYGRDSAPALSPVLSHMHFLYEPAAAVQDRILPVASITTQEVWDHLWPRDGAERATTVATPGLLDAARASAHFPVMPNREILWQALQQGTRENRWVLYLRGPNLSIGAAELAEWPGTPRIDDMVEVWTYQAALDGGIYPRQTRGDDHTPLTHQNLKAACWMAGVDELATEDVERLARGTWTDLTRPRLETVLHDGLRSGTWAVWRKDAPETFYTAQDAPVPTVQVGAQWSLVDPASDLARRLDALRPGRGPQPVTAAGTPRQALTELWNALDAFTDVRVSEMSLTVLDRDSLDNTLLATWPDRPRGAAVHASVVAQGDRVAAGKQETVQLTFEGRLEEVRGMLAAVWPFKTQGSLDVTVSLSLHFDPPLAMTDEDLITYRNALMNANQGEIEATLVPARVVRDASSAVPPAVPAGAS